MQYKVSIFRMILCLQFTCAADIMIRNLPAADI